MKKTLIITFALLISLMSILVNFAAAEPVYYSANGHYYDIVPGPITWDAAKVAAEKLTLTDDDGVPMTGHLATITSQGENDFIISSFSVFQTQFQPFYWLGGFQLPNSEEPAGGWTWVTGEEWSYTNWVSTSSQPNREPSNYYASGVTYPDGWPENALQTQDFNMWNDYPSDVTWTIKGYIVEYECSLLNQPPTIGVITAPIDPVPVYTEITASADFTDSGDDTHTAEWDWGDGTTSPGTVDEDEGSVTGNHAYDTAGVYSITLTITDGAGETDSAIFEYVVIYDPEGGFVTGGGWIDSPSNAYTPEDDADEDLVGKATFGFVSKYKKGTIIPTGNTEFQFQVAYLNFKSTSYEWLVVAGPKAMYKGTGTINGAGNYGFMLTAVDAELTPSTEDVDLFRIKIWDKETDIVVYDNMIDADDDADPTTAIGDGSIVIHK